MNDLAPPTAGAQNARMRGVELLAAAAFVAAYWFVVLNLARQWVADDNYTHGFFVPLMAAALAWRRRAAWRAAPRRASAWGIALVAAGALLHVVGIVAAELFTSRVSLVLVAAGSVLALQGGERWRIMLYPLGFLLFMIPLPYVVYYQLTFPLQLESSRVTATILSLLGMPLYRAGNIIHLEHYSLEVVTACSGLRSIMSLGVIAVFTSDFLRLSAGYRILFIALVVPVAVVVNAGRLATTAIISAMQGTEAAESFLHEASGVGVFVAGLLLLLACGKGMEWLSRVRN
jgi:exosortase